MVFPNINLPAASLPWGREVQKQLELLEKVVISNDVNNTARDTQLATSINRLDGVTVGLAANIEQTNLALSNAQTALTAAQTSINAVISLGSTGSTYDINADNITGGTITGITFRTATSGTRVELNGTQANFYYGPYYVGSIIGDNSFSGNPEMSIFNSTTDNGMILNQTTASLVCGLNGGSSANIGVSSINGTASIWTSSLFWDFGSTSGLTTTNSNITTGGYISSGDFRGVVNTSIANNTTASFAGNTFINTSGTMFRSTFTSSREAKENIRPLVFDSNKYINISPVTFDYKDGIVSDNSGNNVIGFIAEDFVDAGIDSVIIPKDTDGPYMGLRYDKLYMFLHKVVQEQNKTIKELSDRIAILETK